MYAGFIQYACAASHLPHSAVSAALARVVFVAFTLVFIMSLYWRPTWHGKVERPTILWIYLAHPSKH